MNNTYVIIYFLLLCFTTLVTFNDAWHQLRRSVPHAKEQSTLLVSSSQKGNTENTWRSNRLWSPSTQHISNDYHQRRFIPQNQSKRTSKSGVVPPLPSMTFKDITAEVTRRLSLASVLQSYGIDLKYNNPISYRCVCPFHNDHHPSMLVNEGPGYYYCFTCQASGNAISFISKKEKISFSQAARVCYHIIKKKKNEEDRRSGSAVEEVLDSGLFQKLFDKFCIRTARNDRHQIIASSQSQPQRRETNKDVPFVQEFHQQSRPSAFTETIAAEKAKDILKIASTYFMAHLLFNPDSKNVRDYLMNRGISLKTAMEFQLGYAPDFHLKRTSCWKDNELAPLSSSPSSLLLGQHGISPSCWPLVANKSLELFLQSSFCEISKGQITIQDIIACGLIKNNTAFSLSRPVIDRFRNRLMVPIRDANGDIVAFGGRVLEQSSGHGPSPSAASRISKPIRVAKYINSPTSVVFQKKHTLFGFDIAARYAPRKNYVLMVEGYFDVIALFEAGIKNAVATMGTAVTSHQLLSAASLSRSGNIVLLLDGDEAGQAASERAVQVLQKLTSEYQNDSKRLTANFPQRTPQSVKLWKASISAASDCIRNLKLVPKVPCDIHQLSLKDCGELFEFFHPKDVKIILDHIVKHSVEMHTCLI